MSIDPEKVLSSLQTYHHRLNTTGTYSSYVVGAQLNLDIEANFAQIRDAFDSLVSQRIVLRLNVKEVKGKLYPVEVSFNINSLFEKVEKQYTTELLNELHAIRFKPGTENLLWKVVITTDNWLLIVSDHTYVDGSSICFLLEELGAILNGKPIDQDSNHDRAIFKITSPGVGYTLKQLWDLEAPESLKSFTNHFRRGRDSKFYSFGPTWLPTSDPPHPNSDFRSLKHEVVISKDQMARLIPRLKGNGVRFSSYLIYVILRCLSQFTDGSISGITAINLRRYLGIPLKSYGVFVSVVSMNLYAPKQKEIDWELVKYIHGQLSEERQRESAQLIGLSKFINAAKFLKDTASSPRRNVYSMSNLGVREDFKGEKFSYQDFTFSQPASPINSFVIHDVIACSSNTKIMIGAVPEFESFFENYIKDFEELFEF